MAGNNLQLFNLMTSLLYSKEMVPEGFHDRVGAVRTMLKDDVTGLVDSLTDFAVDSATVNFNIESENRELENIFKEWLEDINTSFNGLLPIGIEGLEKQFYREVWKGSSFPVLKLGGWKIYGKKEGAQFKLPSRIFFVNGGDIYSKKKEDNDEININSYDYYLTNKFDKSHKLNGKKHVIFSRPYGRFFDEYPDPFLIKRGIYHNYKIIDMIKNSQSQVLDQVIPYMLHIIKGNENLEAGGYKAYTPKELDDIRDEFKALINKLKDTTQNAEGLVRATNPDEQIKQLVPDITDMFQRELTVTAERNILSGLGFIDVIEATSTSRKESILNPKGFISEVEGRVKDFKQIMKLILIRVKQENKNNHTKYASAKTYVIHSPITAFREDKFKDKIRQLWDRGNISTQSYVELVGELDFNTEIERLKKEAERGIDLITYPPARFNVEGKGYDLKPNVTNETDKNDNEIDEDKRDELEKKEYDQGAKKQLITAPYNTISDLPPDVKNSLTKELQKVFLEVFNDAYDRYGNDTLAFKTAWKVIKRIGEKGDDGKWHKKKAMQSLLNKVKATFGGDIKISDKLVEKAYKDSLNELKKEYEALRDIINNDNREE